MKLTPLVLSAIFLSMYATGCDPGDGSATDPSTEGTGVETVQSAQMMGSRDVPVKSTVQVKPNYRLATAIWECPSPTWGSAQQVDCYVGPGYIVIGGGAWADYGAGGNGALLTASHPKDSNLLAWTGASKDHVRVQAHNLKVYAIGVRIVRNNTNVPELTDVESRSILFNNMRYLEETSGLGSTPNKQVSLPSEFKLLGGGARVNWSGWGNLLKWSVPAANGWYAGSKDHLYSSPATITVKAIGIRPSFGIWAGNVYRGDLGIETAIKQGPSYWHQSGVGNSEVSADWNWAIASIGGSATSWGYGRMLYRLAPKNLFDVMISTKDHIYADSGESISSMVQFRSY